MSKITIVYRSRSGRTEVMANAITKGMQASGDTADI